MFNSKLIIIAVSVQLLCICLVAEAFNFNSPTSILVNNQETFNRKTKQRRTEVVSRNTGRPLMMNMFSSSSSSRKSKEIYSIPGSGWTSPSWNWGYASGTGHDCALLCRRKYSTEQKRQELIHELLHPKPFGGQRTEENNGQGNGVVTVPIEEVDGTLRDPPFEEVKLILGLTIQRGRWDGTDVDGVYNEVLALMAQAERYESDDEEINAKNFVHDLSDRFQFIAGNTFVTSGRSSNSNGKEDGSSDDVSSSSNNVETMKEVEVSFCHDYDMMRRICTGLVLQQMGFVELGL